MNFNQKAFLTVCIICGVVLIVQIILYRRVEERHHSAHHKVRYSSEAYEFLKHVTTLLHGRGVTLALGDPSLLKSLLNEKDHTRYCRFLCEWRTLSFVAFGDETANKNDQSTISDLIKSGGYDVNSVYGRDPRVYDAAVLIPTHLTISHGSFLIHIVFFYERPGSYWWHAKFPEALTDLPFSKHDGAIDIQDMRQSALDGITFQIFRNTNGFLSQLHSSRYIECNHTRAAGFRAEFPNLDYDDAFHSLAKKVLTRAHSRLNDVSVPFWLSSGTLLGWYRQCDFITYSKDVDLGIFIKDYKSEIVRHFKSTGFPLSHEFGFVKDSYQLSFHSGPVKLDFFFFYKERDHIWNGGTQAKTLKKFKYTFPLFTLCWTEFMELKVRVPCDPLSYIEANYGKNWYQPVTEWDWKQSPPNVKEVGKWSDQVADDAVIFYDAKGRRVFIERDKP